MDWMKLALSDAAGFGAVAVTLFALYTAAQGVAGVALLHLFPRLLPA